MDLRSDLESIEYSLVTSETRCFKFFFLFPFSLQKFKLNIANTVIGQDNSSLQTMNTADMLDLFQVSGSEEDVTITKNKVSK